MPTLDLNAGWGRTDAETVRPFWHQYRESRDPALRERLIEHYLPFARMLAAKAYANRIQLELEFADYLQYASIGLVEAVDRFDPSLMAKFETFSALRINGAILNGIVSLTEKQEQISVRKSLLAERVKSLKTDTNAPKAKDPEGVFKYLAELAIGLAVGFALEGTGMYQADEGSYEENAYRRVELKQFCGKLAEMMESLPDKERRIIKLHYHQQLPFDEIAQMLGVTKGRVSQIHKSALARLRSGFGKGIDFQC